MKYVFIHCTGCPVGPLNLETFALQFEEILTYYFFHNVIPTIFCSTQMLDIWLIL